MAFGQLRGPRGLRVTYFAERASQAGQALGRAAGGSGAAGRFLVQLIPEHSLLAEISVKVLLPVAFWSSRLDVSIVCPAGREDAAGDGMEQDAPVDSCLSAPGAGLDRASALVG